MVYCPHCFKANLVKNGIVNKRQRYKCKLCNYTFTRIKKCGYSRDIKKEALILYLQGMGYREIGRKIHVDHVTVMNWMRKISENIYNSIDEFKRYENTPFRLDVKMYSYCCRHNIEITKTSPAWMRLVPRDFQTAFYSHIH